MSLDAATIETLRETHREKVESLEKENHDLRQAIERQKENITSLEMMNATLRRRVASLEGVDGE